MKEILRKKELALLGIAGPAIAWTAIAVSIMGYPGFSWQDNALSDLGVSNMANIFNFGLIIAGIILVIFIIHVLIKLERGLLRTTGLLVLLFSMIFLICIGIFTEDYGQLHWNVSVAFFMLLGIAILLLAISFFVDEEFKKIGILAFIVFGFGFISWLIPWGPNVAIPETLSAFPACMWAAVLGVKVYKMN